MDSRAYRRTIYALLAGVALAQTFSRICSTENAYQPSLSAHYPHRDWPSQAPEPTPFFGSNDRSRWATVRALVDDKTFVVGRRDLPKAKEGFTDTGIKTESSYKSVDLVMNPETGEFFSTKPLVLTVMAAGEYWLIKNLFGVEITREPWPIDIAVLLTLNLLPWAAMLWMLGRLLEMFGGTDWGRIWVFAAACFGTFLPTFAVTFANHTPAACAAMASLYLFLTGGKALSRGRALLAGSFAGLALVFDFPAAALGGCLGLWLLIREEYRAAAWFALGALPPVLALFGLNYLAMGDVIPPYAKFGSEWYEYAGSHWLNKEPGKKGIDYLDQPKSIYLFNNTFGMHGVFSLTPIFLISLVSMVRSAGGPTPSVMRGLSRMTLFILAVVLAFYVIKTNNYGGWTVGPRWLFWLTPLLLVGMIPAADRLSRTLGGRMLGVTCLAISAFSTIYSSFNPWRHPWLYQVMEYYGVVQY